MAASHSLFLATATIIDGRPVHELPVSNKLSASLPLLPPPPSPVGPACLAQRDPDSGRVRRLGVHPVCLLQARLAERGRLELRCSRGSQQQRMGKREGKRKELGI